MSGKNNCSSKPRPVAGQRVTLALGMALFCSGQSALAFDLSETLARARSNDPVFQAARLQRDALAEKLPQARAALLPGIQLRAGANAQSGQAAFADAPAVERNANASHWSLQLTQVLWNRSAQLGVDQANAHTKLADTQLRLAEQELLLRVAQAYLEAGFAEENVGVVEAQTKAVCEQLKLAERNFDAGISTITDVHEAKSRHDLVQAQKASAQTDLESKLAELERILGEPLSQLKRLNSMQSLPDVALEITADWVEAARHHALQVHVHLAHVDIADWELQRAKAAHSPTLELTASYGGNRSRGSVTTPMDISSRSRSSQVSLQLNVPLYSGGSIDSRIREASLLRQKAHQDLEAAKRLAASSAKAALSAIRHGKSQIGALSSAVIASRASLESNRVGYRIGTRINVDVLNAQQQLFVAKRDLYRSRVDYLMSVLRLKATIGALEDADLASIDRLLAARKQAHPV